MKRVMTAVVPAVAALLATDASSDNPKDANPIVEELKIAGTFLTSRIDANHDLSHASWCTSQIKGGQQGSSMLQCVNEDVFAGVTSDCPGGLWVVDGSYGGTGVGVRSFPDAADQIFVRLTERHLCADANGRFTDGNDRGVITGGIGRFAGATGTYEWHYTGQVLYGDPAAQPEQFFGSISGTGTWVIDLPE